jgi:nucleotide-binding universal stress UspA family protein
LTEATRSPDDIDKILVPTDGSTCSDKAVSFAGNLAKKLSAEVHVLFVAETHYCGPWFHFFLDEDICEKVKTKGQEIAEKAARSLRHGGVASAEAHVGEGHPGEVIPKMATELRVDLIVMGTHGRRGLERALMGSVAREVANTSSVPLLLVK